MSERIIMSRKISKENQAVETVISFVNKKKSEETIQKRLAKHFFYSFKGTIDDEDETIAEWLQEVKKSFQGGHGPLLKEHSFYIEEGKKIIGSAVVSLFRGVPLVIYVAVDPDKRGQGLSKKLLQQMFYSFEESSYQEIFLVVTPGNFPAETLYKKMGFKPVGSNWDKVLAQREIKT